MKTAGKGKTLRTNPAAGHELHLRRRRAAMLTWTRRRNRPASSTHIRLRGHDHRGGPHRQDRSCQPGTVAQTVGSFRRIGRSRLCAGGLHGLAVCRGGNGGSRGHRPCGRTSGDSRFAGERRVELGPIGLTPDIYANCWWTTGCPSRGSHLRRSSTPGCWCASTKTSAPFARLRSRDSKDATMLLRPGGPACSATAESRIILGHSGRRVNRIRTEPWLWFGRFGWVVGVAI